MSKKIIRRSVIRELMLSEANLLPVLKRVYAARQIKSSQELSLDTKDLLSFETLLNINDAAQFIANAIMAQKKILIVGDFDADGATSTVVAMRSLRLMGAKHINFLVPNRFLHGYGLTPELVVAAEKTRHPDVIITVDNGIANHAGVQAAKALNISVVITDHHLPGEILPAADVIVNPNLSACSFPSKNLAGVGVIFYVMLAVRKELLARDWFLNQKIPNPNMARLLDLVALGTVADLVPLDHNNRILVHQGLMRIRHGRSVPGIIALLELANRDYKTIVTADLGFAVGARLNAAGRLEDMSIGIECLLTDDSAHARHLAKNLDELNMERRSIEQTMQAKAIDTISHLNLSLANLPKGLCLFDEKWHQGVIGILASRLKDKYHRPVIIFAKGQESELKGSARSIANFHIRDALAQIDAKFPGLIKKFGGHAMAAGLSIEDKNFSLFQKIFDETVSGALSEYDLTPCILSDGELEIADYNLKVAEELRQGGPWGQAFPEPIFDDIFIVVEQRLLRDKHLKLRLKKAEKILDAIAFFIDTTLWPNHRCQKIRAAFRLDVNEFQDARNLQLIVDYFETV